MSSLLAISRLLKPSLKEPLHLGWRPAIVCALLCGPGRSSERATWLPARKRPCDGPRPSRLQLRDTPASHRLRRYSWRTIQHSGTHRVNRNATILADAEDADNGLHARIAGRPLGGASSDANDPVYSDAKLGHPLTHVGSSGPTFAASQSVLRPSMPRSSASSPGKAVRGSIVAVSQKTCPSSDANGAPDPSAGQVRHDPRVRSRPASSVRHPICPDRQ